VNLANDGANCGACGATCSTGVCQSSACVVGAVGNEVTIGLSYDAIPAWQTEARKVLANAAFMSAVSNGGKCRIFGFDPYASPSRVNVDAALAAAASQHGVKSYSNTHVSDPKSLLDKLSTTTYETLVVYDQPGAPAGALATLGAKVASTIDAFTKAGGVVVVLASSGGVSEMWAFSASAGIMGFEGATAEAYPGKVVDIAPSDSLGQGVSTVFATPQGSVSFQLAMGAQPVTSVITSFGTGAPVALHRVILP
jgi:hypothetical protein